MRPTHTSFACATTTTTVEDVKYKQIVFYFACGINVSHVTTRKRNIPVTIRLASTTQQQQQQLLLLLLLLLLLEDS